MSTLVTCHKCFQTIREIGGDEFGVHIHELCHACQMELVSKLNNAIYPVGGLSCTVEAESKMTPTGGSGINEETRKKSSQARCGRVIRKSDGMGG